MSLHRIEVTPFPLLISEMIAQRKNGILTVIREQERKQLYWVNGEVALITSNSAQESLGSYLFRRTLIDEGTALRLSPEDWTATVPLLHERGEVEIHNKDTLLREWLVTMALPLFSFEQGNAIFTDAPPLEEERRVVIRSMPAFVLEGVRSIASGMVLRRSLGDIRRKIAPSQNPLFLLTSIPFAPHERQIATSLHDPEIVEHFIKRVSADSVVAAKTIIAMMALNLFTIYEEPPKQVTTVAEDPQRDLMLLATIGAEDERSLRAVTLARQLPQLNHYEILRLSRMASKGDISARVAELKKRFDPSTYPPIVKEYVETILKRLTQVTSQLTDEGRRHEYDALLKKSEHSHDMSMEQTVTRRAMAEKNYRRASDLSVQGDYYGAIVLLRQAVDFAPDHADAWFLLGSCQARNPQWRRDAMDSYQKALSANPNHVEAMIALGDLYQKNGLASRAESCYEGVLQFDPENTQASARLKKLKGKTEP